jgi:hypothetical protein
MGARLVAVMMVAIALAGPIQSLALAQAPQSQDPQTQSAQPQPGQPQPELFQGGTQAQPPQPEPAQQQPQQVQQPQPAPQPQQAQQQEPQPQPAQRTRSRSDVYDVGAGAMTVVGMPLKGLTCALGVVLGFGLFIATVGSGDRATAAVIDEGCNQRWIVRGDDIRPAGSRHDRMRSRYDGDLR